MKILFASSEAQPLIKTGGLADVAGSLPLALSRLGHDVRLVLPAYPEALSKAGPVKTVATLGVEIAPEPVHILEGRLGSGLPLYLVDAPGLFDRGGNPYTDSNGNDWRDNARRFAVFCHAITALGLNSAGTEWTPDVVHCNDWQTGLVPAFMNRAPERPATVFTIHNLAYQGLFDHPTFTHLHLASELWSFNALEFHGNFSFIKGGLAFADWINTVSPTYAEEILTPAFGYGLEGLLRHRSDRFMGILNGIDYDQWNPAADPLIEQTFDARGYDRKLENKLALQRAFGLDEDPQAPLFGHIGRLVEQKGVDIILDILPRLFEHPKAQLIVLGSGSHWLESQLIHNRTEHPRRMAVTVGYDEALAHRIEAGSDCFLMPSRFEPCGLNQLYSLRYGTLPIVHGTGGLADTVVDATPGNVRANRATGFVFETPEPDALWDAVQRALSLFEERERWETLAITGMAQDFSWEASAKRYLGLYQKAIDEPAPSPL